MWTIECSDEYLRRGKKYSKRHCSAYVATHENLETYIEALNRGALVRDIKFGFIHSEPMGVKAIDQKGAAHAKELRLYIYPESVEQVVYLLTMGDKNTQQDDIKNCKAAVQNIRQGSDSND